jgi:hypothetical protein
MIKQEVLVTILRFYPSDSADPLAKYTACCTIMWESAHVIWLKGLVGTLSKQNLKELAKFFIDNDIHLVKAIRANESMPFVTKVDGNYCEIDVLMQNDRLRKFAS